ncbi:MAG: hypothetical protein ACK56I_35405, partial [bacterium]
PAPRVLRRPRASPLRAGLPGVSGQRPDRRPLPQEHDRLTAPAEPRRAIPPRRRRCVAKGSAMGAPVAGPGWACNSGQAILAPLLAATLGHTLSHGARHELKTSARERAVVARTRSRDDNSLSTPPPL